MSLFVVESYTKQIKKHSIFTYYRGYLKSREYHWWLFFIVTNIQTIYNFIEWEYQERHHISIVRQSASPMWNLILVGLLHLTMSLYHTGQQFAGLPQVTSVHRHTGLLLVELAYSGAMTCRSCIPAAAAAVVVVPVYSVSASPLDSYLFCY